MRDPGHLTFHLIFKGLWEELTKTFRGTKFAYGPEPRRIIAWNKSGKNRTLLHQESWCMTYDMTVITFASNSTNCTLYVLARDGT